MSVGVKVTAEGSGKSLPSSLAGVAGVTGTGDNVDWEDPGEGAPGSIPGGGNFETKNEGGNPTVKAHGACGATETIDPTDGNVHTLTLDANCTFTLNAPAGTSATLELWITQNSTGGWVITWPGSVTVVGTLSTTLSTTSIVVLTTVNTGASWVAVVVGSSTATTSTSGSGSHEHVVSEGHLSNGVSGLYTLDQAYQSGSVIAWNTTTLARLAVTETEPDQATVSPVGTSGDTITFDYAATLG